MTDRGSPRIQKLELRNISRHFGNVVALDDLELAIRGGEFITLLGPSGCGKSTALNCLAGLLPLSQGSIWVDDQRVDGVPPERRGFGMVFQNYALFPHLTVRRNLAFGLKVQGVEKSEVVRRVDETLELVQLTAHGNKFPSQLSGGQQQRVAIGRAIVLEPSLVLMDEPLSNLDAKLRQEMRTEVRRLHQELGLTTIYVTHDQEEALSLSDRLVLLRDGIVQQIGAPEDVYTEPENRYVAGFMGYRNLFGVDIESANGASATVTGGGLRLDGRLRLDGTNREGVTSGRAIAAIRPEDLKVGEVGDNKVDVNVVVVEFKGREVDVEASTTGGTKVHFRTDKRLAPGENVTLSIPRERVLIFSADSAAAAEEAGP